MIWLSLSNLWNVDASIGLPVDSLVEQGFPGVKQIEGGEVA